MKKLTLKQIKELDKEAQTYKCLYCDSKETVKWNGQQWECSTCGKLYGEKSEPIIL